MESTCKTRTLQWICNQLKSDGISLYHKLQRKEGQWKKDARGLLIDSLLRSYPVNPVYAVKDNNVLSIIDGIQRLSTIRDYLDNEFLLPKTLEPIILTVNTDEGKVEKEFIIAGKKYKKLDKEIQELLLSSELQMYEISNYTEKEVREIFKRQNSGKSLNNSQLRSVIANDEMSEMVYSLTLHPFFDNILGDSQKKKDLDKDIVIETLMLIETNAENDYTCFKSKNIDSFIMSYQDNIDYEKIEFVKQALDKLNENLDDVKVKHLSVPMIIWGMYNVIRGKKSTTKYIAWVNDFIVNYNTNEEYLAYCGSGTSNADMVKGRFQYFKNAVKNM